MKKVKKIFALILALFIVAGVFSACGGEKKVHTGSKFTYWSSLDGNVAHTQQSLGDLLMYQEMAKRTGTEVEFIHPAQGSTGTEAFQILMSSGDYPDMIQYGWKSYVGGPDQAINDGVIIALNDYLKDYAPNYYNYMEGEAGKENNYLYKAASISDSGNYYGFKCLNIGSYKGFYGLYTRKDLLDKWGLDIPQTIDDWTKLFEVAKENGVKYPLTGDKEVVGFIYKDLFNTAWGVGTGFYVDGNKVKFGPFEKGYKEYVAKMAEWNKKGYLDIDYVTNDRTIVHGQITSGNSIAANGYVGGDLGAIIPAMQERDPNFNLVACPYPVLKEGDIPLFQEVQADATDPCIAISVQCGVENEDRYKEAIKWCDYLYSDEGIILKSFGVEGDTFTIEKDSEGVEHYIYTDKITKNYEEFGATNINDALYHFFVPANNPGFNQHPDYFEGFYQYQQQKDAIKTWNTYVDDAKKTALPPISFTGEESTEKANIESKGKDNLTAAISNIILGKLPVEDYDKAISDAKKAGYDRLLEIYQAAYDRHVKVINGSK